MSRFLPARREAKPRPRPTPRQTLVRTLSLAGMVLIVGGTALGLRSVADGAAGLGLGSPPARSMTLYVTSVTVAQRGSNGHRVTVHFEGDDPAAYPRMDASDVDAKFAIFAKPRRGDCCWQPARISWHDDAATDEIALPIAYAPASREGATIDFPTLAQPELTSAEVEALVPLSLAREPLIATIDIGSLASPRVYDLHPASDAEIARHERNRTLAHR